jgi:hypothetical protein
MPCDEMIIIKKENLPNGKNSARKPRNLWRKRESLSEPTRKTSENTAMNIVEKVPDPAKNSGKPALFAAQVFEGRKIS